MNPLTWLLDILRRALGSSVSNEPIPRSRSVQSQSIIINPRNTATNQQVIRPLEFVVTEEKLSDLIHQSGYINVPLSREVTPKRSGR